MRLASDFSNANKCDRNGGILLAREETVLHKFSLVECFVWFCIW